MDLWSVRSPFRRRFERLRYLERCEAVAYSSRSSSVRSFGSVAIELFNRLMLRVIGADSSVRVNDAAKLTLRRHLIDAEWPLIPSDAAQHS